MAQVEPSRSAIWPWTMLIAIHDAYRGVAGAHHPPACIGVSPLFAMTWPRRSRALTHLCQVTQKSRHGSHRAAALCRFARYLRVAHDLLNARHDRTRFHFEGLCPLVAHRILR